MLQKKVQIKLKSETKEKVLLSDRIQGAVTGEGIWRLFQPQDEEKSGDKNARLQRVKINHKVRQKTE